MKKNKITADIARAAIVLIAFFIFANLAFAIPDSLTLQGKLTNLAGAVQTGNFNFSFKIYDSYTGGNILWKNLNSTVTTDANGIYDIILSNLSSLNFSEQYFLGITVGQDSESEPRINLTSSPYSFRANISEDLNKENKYTMSALNITNNLTIGDSFTDALTVTTGRLNISDGNIKIAGNLSLSQKITFGFGQIIDNLVSGFLRITGNLNVTGNVSFAQNTLFVDNTSGRVGIGTASPAFELHIKNPGTGHATIQLQGTQAGDVAWDIMSGFPNAGDFTIREDGIANYLTIKKTSGNVGIGKTSPNYKLDVAGTINSSAIKVTGPVNITNGNLTMYNTTSTPVYIKFGAGGYMYDNGTALILGHD